MLNESIENQNIETEYVESELERINKSHSNKNEKEPIDEAFIDKNGRVVKKVFAVIFLLLFLGLGVFFIYQYKVGAFKDADSFKNYINSFGYFGPVLLMIIQCFKVFYAIIPGLIGCIAGAALFGTVGSFLCNYIGICAGSIFAFLLSRKFGFSILRMIFSEKKIKSYKKWMNRWTKHYHIFLWVAILFPFSPDDFLCYFTGLTQMKFKKFVIIILTAKPWAILAYSLIFGNII